MAAGFGFSINFVSLSHIDGWVLLDGKKWPLTGFYGSLSDVASSASWSLLKRLRGSDDVPWIVGGDFNEVLHHSKKTGSRPKTDLDILPFRLAMECGMMDMGYRGDCFTWINRQEDGATILDWLDRCLCNSAWHHFMATVRFVTLVFIYLIIA